MNHRLHELAAEHGIQREYFDIEDRLVTVGDATLEALLTALGVPLPPNEAQEDRAEACYLPPFLERGRAWGVTCQAYGLRSRRNLGIGDFEDLARLGEIVAGFGADFLGVSPLHAPFLAAPERCSPFFPSNRLLLNPLLIAVDRVAGFDASDVEEREAAKTRASGIIDYRQVAAVKIAALRRIFGRSAPPDRPVGELEALRARYGPADSSHALFEAVSAEMVRRGHGAGWHSWPVDWQTADAPAVAEFARAHADEVAFHLWLQETASKQLAGLADRLRRAGMRIGLYLDLAVGVAPDGSATWGDPGLTVAEARIGAPPDMFNETGQDWGLAPLAPRALLDRDMRPIRELYDSALRHAGALRIDHAMSLQRLYWIPKAMAAVDGTYVRYPMDRLLAELGRASQRHRAIVIGEDLGVVPKGFREVMQAHRMLSYRVLMFEREKRGFRPPEDYPAEALACVATHDTATLAGWWRGTDIDDRRYAGLYGDAEADAARRQRAVERRQLAALLRRSLGVGARSNARYSTSLAVAVHRLAASTPCRLFAVQLEDLLGLSEQANIPGTVDEHPNWRRRMPIDVDTLPASAGASAILQAVAEERPRP